MHYSVAYGGEGMGLKGNELTKEESCFDQWWEYAVNRGLR